MEQIRKNGYNIVRFERLNLPPVTEDDFMEAEHVRSYLCEEGYYARTILGPHFNGREFQDGGDQPEPYEGTYDVLHIGDATVEARLYHAKDHCEFWLQITSSKCVDKLVNNLINEFDFLLD